jgi:hypothetical protein
VAAVGLESKVTQIFKLKEHLIQYLETRLIAKGRRPYGLKNILNDYLRISPFVAEVRSHIQGPITKNLVNYFTREMFAENKKL